MDLDKVFNPSSIAVVGASERPGSVGNDVVKNLVTQGYQGKIYPVNPKLTELFGLKCYPTISSINESVDTVVVAIPATAVPGVMEEAGNGGVKGAIIISAGFKESGNLDLENQLQEIAIKNNIALIGANCLGVINPKLKMNASFAALMPVAGPVAFLSQSGALCTAVIDYANSLEIGFSKFVSMGNKTAVDEVEMLKYLFADKDTKVIVMYAEQLKKSQELIFLVKENRKGKNPKPVIVIKAGKTIAGATASASHTGALAGNDSAYEALFSQSGMVRVNRASELFEHVQVFVNNGLAKGKRVAVITNAGGPGVLATDELIQGGLELAKFSDKTIEELKKVLPGAASIHNPIDILGDARSDRYLHALEAVVVDEGVDSLLIILTPQSMTEVDKTAEIIINLKKKTVKPIVVNFMGSATVDQGILKLRNSGVATMEFPEQSAKALVALTNFSLNVGKKDGEKFNNKNVDKNKVKEIFERVKNEGRNSLPEVEALEVLRAYDFPLAKFYVAKNEVEAIELAKKIKGRVVLKIISKDILHKTDIGGVILDVSQEEIGENYLLLIDNVKQKAPTAKIEGVLIEEMIKNDGGLEMIIGSSTDPSFGQLIMVGLGGIYVEVFKDAVFALPPVTRDEVEIMIEKLKANKILSGVRGRKPLAKEKLIDCVGRLSQLLQDFPEIKELDLNPVLVGSDEVIILDARIVLA